MRVFQWLISRHKWSCEVGCGSPSTLRLGSGQLEPALSLPKRRTEDFDIIEDCPFMLSMVEAFMGFSQRHQE
jgi:hypothetical protein